MESLPRMECPAGVQALEFSVCGLGFVAHGLGCRARGFTIKGFEAMGSELRDSRPWVQKTTDWVIASPKPQALNSSRALCQTQFAFLLPSDGVACQLHRSKTRVRKQGVQHSQMESECDSHKWGCYSCITLLSRR